MKEFEVEIYVAKMYSPHVATVTIVAESEEEAKKWVQDHIELIVKE